MPARLAIIATVECALIAALIWANLARYDQGPILVQLTESHGIHLTDALIGALILLTPILAMRNPPGFKTQNLKPKTSLTSRTCVRIMPPSGTLESGAGLGSAKPAPRWSRVERTAG